MVDENSDVVKEILTDDLVWEEFGKGDYHKHDPATIKKRSEQLYDGISEQLNLQEFREHALFLNVGYVADESSQHAVIEIPKYLINKNSIKLALEVIGNCDLSNSRTLDIGCGRGGNVSVVAEYFQAKEITGIDLSATAIEFCEGNYNYENTRFLKGDAENLPFDDGQFDVVTNFESAHTYPDIRAFFVEVRRVLREGGAFLYTDFMPAEKISEYLSILEGLGFSVEVDRDITRNVLLSCDQTAERHLAAFGGDRQYMADLVATPGSKTYTYLTNGSMLYKIYRFKKL